MHNIYAVKRFLLNKQMSMISIFRNSFLEQFSGKSQVCYTQKINT